MSIPVCAHGKARGHTWRYLPGSNIEKWCPGPMPVAASAEPTTNAALATNLLSWCDSADLDDDLRPLLKCAAKALCAQAAAPLTEEMIEAAFTAHMKLKYGIDFEFHNGPTGSPLYMTFAAGMKARDQHITVLALPADAKPETP